MVMVVVGQFFMLQSDDVDLITKGTSVNGYNISGMTKEGAVEYLGQMFTENAKQFDLTLKHKNKTWNFTKKDFVLR